MNEALTLRVRNIRFDLHPREDGPPPKAIDALETKNDTPRQIPMTNRLRDELARKVQAANLTGTEWLFPSPRTGQPYTNIRKAFHTVRSSEGVKMPPFRIHDLRHGYASRLTEQGIPEQWIAALLGHSDTQMVNRYSHMRSAALTGAADALEKQADDLAEGELIVISRQEWQEMRQGIAKK